MRLAADLRLSAVVAAGVACAIIAVAHLGFNATTWLIGGMQGWTIYPPLSALPQAIPYDNINPDPFEYLVYMGSLTSAAVAGGLSLGCLLASAVVRRRHAAETAQRMLPLWLPVALLLPLAVHLIGWGYRAYRAQQQELLIMQEGFFPDNAGPQPLPPSAVDSLTEAEDDAMDEPE